MNFAKQHAFLFPLSLCLIAALAHRGTCQAAERSPNIIVIFADDLGYGELGCQGNREIPTPHIL